MIPYVLHVTVILTVCCLFYKLLLQRATFYQLNRWVLLSCLVISFVLPFLPAPRGWGWVANHVRGWNWTEKHIAAGQQTTDLVMSSQVSTDPTVLRDAGLSTVPAIHPQRSTKTVHLPAAASVHPKATPVPNTPVVTSDADNNNVVAAIPMLLRILTCCYLVGVCLFGAHFLLQLAVLCYQAYARPAIREGRFRIVTTQGNRAPCSFGNNIFINPTLYDVETYQQILVHEKIHVSGGHTLDILIAEGAVVLQWFNPFAWMYRREVENNLEFLTDQNVLLHQDMDRSAYQLSLLRVAAPNLPFTITNNFNQSLLKRRIVMMNSQRSPRFIVWKYFFLLPLLTVLVCLLNKPMAFSQSAPPANPAAPAAPAAPANTGMIPPAAVPHAAIRPDTTIRPAHRAAAAAEAPPAVPATVRIDPNMPVQSPGSPDTQAPPAVDMPPAIDIDTSINIQLREGSWFITTRGDQLQFELRADSGSYTWSSSFPVDKNELNPFPGVGNVTFKLVREAGTMNFKGQFNGREGFGHFEFQPDAAYFSAIQQMGVEINEGREGALFCRNIKKDYIAMLQQSGLTPIALHYVIALSAQHVDKAYIDDLKAAGYDHLAVHELIRLKARHIDGQYARSMNANGASVPARDLVGYQEMHITPEYIKSFQDAGFIHFEPRFLQRLKAMGITPDYLKDFSKIGYNDIPINLLGSLRANGIDAAYVSSMKEKGFNSPDLRKYIRLKQTMREFN